MMSLRACSILGSSVLRALTLGVAALAHASVAEAGLVQFFTDHDVAYTQTSNAQPTVESFATFNVSVTTNAGTDFTAMTVANPGPTTPINVTPVASGSVFWQYFQTFSTKAQLEAAFPAGTYTLSATGGTSGPASATMSSAQSFYPQTVPFLTGTTFSNLQGLNPTLPFTYNWNTFVTGSSIPNSSSILFDIRDAVSGNSVFFQSLASTATTVTIAANTFLANRQYGFELDFVNDLNGTSGGAATELRYSYSTTGSFQTGAPVPEPSSLLMIMLAGGLIGVGRAWTGRRGSTAPGR